MNQMDRHLPRMINPQNRRTSPTRLSLDAQNVIALQLLSQQLIRSVKPSCKANMRSTGFPSFQPMDNWNGHQKFCELAAAPRFRGKHRIFRAFGATFERQGRETILCPLFTNFWPVHYFREALAFSLIPRPLDSSKLRSSTENYLASASLDALSLFQHPYWSTCRRRLSLLGKSLNPASST